MSGSNNVTEVFLKNYQAVMANGGDPRTKDWPFVESPIVPATVTIIYVLISVLGPVVMKNRKPWDLGHLLTGYNLALVVLSAYMTYEMLMSSILAKYSLGCQYVDYSNDPLSLRMASAIWVFYMSKFVETIDTVIFVVRKKNNQITFLHVFHHATMMINAWLIVKYIAGGAAFFHAVINSGVHTIMYTYYGLSALGPAAQPFLWWKKYLTKIQLMQFVCVAIHAFFTITMCHFPFAWCCLAAGYSFVMLALFSNYYYHEYFRRAKLRAQQKQTKQGEINGNITNKGTEEAIVVNGNGSSMTSKVTHRNGRHEASEKAL